MEEAGVESGEGGIVDADGNIVASGKSNAIGIDGGKSVESAGSGDSKGGNAPDKKEDSLTISSASISATNSTVLTDDKGEPVEIVDKHKPITGYPAERPRKPLKQEKKQTLLDLECAVNEAAKADENKWAAVGQKAKKGEDGEILNSRPSSVGADVLRAAAASGNEDSESGSGSGEDGEE